MARAMCGNPYYFLENDLHVWENRLIFAAGSISYLGLIHGKTISNHGKNAIMRNRYMDKIGLIDVDKTRFPNLALGKMAAYHRSLGDSVEWADPMFGSYDMVYASKVFKFTPDFTDYYDYEVVKGGTGYDIHSELPPEIDRLQPDYSIYPDIDSKTAYGFLTRGCARMKRWDKRNKEK